MDHKPTSADAWHKPLPGVYTYKTEGTATFRIARHDYPSATYAILHSADACNWSLRHSLVEEDVDEFSYCTDDDLFQWFSWKIARSFFGVRQSWDYRCRRLIATRDDVKAGRDLDIDCATDEGDRAEGRGKFAGVETLTISGSSVQAYHYVVDISLHGSFKGSLTSDLWLEVASGLRVRERRTIDGSIPAGPYREELRLDLTSMTPAT